MKNHVILQISTCAQRKIWDKCLINIQVPIYHILYIKIIRMIQYHETSQNWCTHNISSKYTHKNYFRITSCFIYNVISWNSSGGTPYAALLCSSCHLSSLAAFLARTWKKKNELNTSIFKFRSFFLFKNRFNKHCVWQATRKTQGFHRTVTGGTSAFRV